MKLDPDLKGSIFDYQFIKSHFYSSFKFQAVPRQRKSWLRAWMQAKYVQGTVIKNKREEK